MGYHRAMGKSGGYAYGLGEAEPTAGSTADLTQAPQTPVRAERLCIDAGPVNGTTAGDTLADIGVESLRFNQTDIDIPIGNDDTGPWETFAPDSVVNPVIDAYVDNNTSVLLRLSNAGATDSQIASAGFRSRVAPGGAGFEEAIPAGGPKVGTGRVIHLGGSEDTGATRSGTPDETQDLYVYHLVIQAETNDFLVSALRWNQDDYLTGGSCPMGFFRRDSPLFTFGGRRVSKSDTITLTTEDGTSGFHTEGITARIAA